MRVRFGFGLPGPFFVTSSKPRRPASSADEFLFGVCFIIGVIGVTWAIIASVF